VKICAVQSSYLHSNYIRAKRWHLVAGILEEVDASAAEEVLTALA
jgi:hypothetical protein